MISKIIKGNLSTPLYLSSDQTISPLGTYPADIPTDIHSDI